jgi:hypothetical protein
MILNGGPRFTWAVENVRMEQAGRLFYLAAKTR